MGAAADGWVAQGFQKPQSNAKNWMEARDKR
jgi:hypothetical protein